MSRLRKNERYNLSLQLMSLILKLIQLSFKQQLAYRMSLWAGLATNLFFGLLRAALLISLYGSRNEVNGLTITGAITYIGVAQALIAFLTVFGSFDLMNTIYSGLIGSDLLKPVSFYLFWLCRDFGKSLVNLVGRGVLFLFLFQLFYPVSLPVDLDQWVLLIFSLLLSWLVSFSWRFLVNLAAFWSPDARGILRIAFTLSQFLSGFIMPLRLLPDWFQQIISYTPFPAMINTSIEIYLGVLRGADLWNALLNQLLWFFVLVAVAHWVLQAGVRKLVIQGG